jgi:tetratricopeptide (TPR) repeat protein
VAKAPAKPPAVQKPAIADSGAGRVSKREIPRTAAEEAEGLFRHGVVVLNQGRIAEAQADFSAALAKYPGHEPARQALIALQIERRKLDDARRLLEEGLAVNPANAPGSPGACWSSAATTAGGECWPQRQTPGRRCDYQLLYSAVRSAWDGTPRRSRHFKRRGDHRPGVQPGLHWNFAGSDRAQGQPCSLIAIARRRDRRARCAGLRRRPDPRPQLGTRPHCAGAIFSSRYP